MLFIQMLKTEHYLKRKKKQQHKETTNKAYEKGSIFLLWNHHL